MITIQSPNSKQDFKAYYALRYRILREPLGLPRGTEKDDYESISTHFSALDEVTGQIVGVVKLYEDEPGIGRVSHLAVDPAYQKRGVGSRLLSAAEVRARQNGFNKLVALTRKQTIRFYERFGYKDKGLAKVIFDKLELFWLEKEL